MKYELNGAELRLFPEGRIDAQNAPKLEAEISALVAEKPHSRVVFDASLLVYLSSAGLRIVLRLLKAEPTLCVENAGPEVYDIFEMTGFTEMLPVVKAYRCLSVNGCEMLGQGSNGIVYRYDPELVVKVYRNPDAIEDIRRERELARKALILGIPTAIPFDVVKVGDRYASVFELLNAESFSSLIAKEPENRDHYIDLFTDLLRQIHATKVDPGDMPSMKETALRWCADLAAELPAASHAKLESLIRAVPERHTMLHGDYHTNNVEMQNGEVLLIDMDTLAWGHPIFELATMFLAFEGFYELDHSGSMKFLKLPYETVAYIWQRFLPLYLGTDDPAVIKDVRNKARVIGFTRLLRRTIRRNSHTEEGQALIAYCRKKLISLLETVDTLEFL